MKTIIVGLGNPILGDDGVGWKVAEAVKLKLASAEALPLGLPSPQGSGRTIDIECLSLGGLSLMEHLIGYQHAILIDAFKPTTDEALGSIIVLKLSDLPTYSAFHVTSAHDTSLQHALELGKSMGAALPHDVMVVGIITHKIYDFHEGLSQPVADAVTLATDIVLDLLQQSVMV